MRTHVIEYISGIMPALTLPTDIYRYAENIYTTHLHHINKCMYIYIYV